MKMTRFSSYSWGVLGYTILVILWGAFVRATGSGAGCGANWPLCNGEIVPPGGQAATLIEYGHRLSSGFALLLVVGLMIWSFRVRPAGHRVRKAAVVSLAFMLLEALIGAGLVLLELVAENQSIARALWMAAHLVNTFLLLGALTTTAWWASGGAPIRLRGQRPVSWLLGGGLAAMLLLGVSGAVTALGDTLFPVASLAEGVREDFSATAHVLVRLRIFHPLIALVVGLYLMISAGVVARERPGRAAQFFARAVAVLFLVQVGAGFLNLALLAPVWLQLVHLLLADLVWIALVLLALSSLRLEIGASTDTGRAAAPVDHAPGTPVARPVGFPGSTRT